VEVEVAPVTAPPRFLSSAAEPPGAAAPIVAREPELAKLDRALAEVLTNQGRVVFVTGEAGSGKTVLVHEFAQRAQAASAELLVVTGNCNAHTGLGDPYLPWRDMLGLLSGGIEAAWTRGLITRENAARLWALLPVSTQAVLDLGPALIDTFIPAGILTMRAVRAGEDGSTRADRAERRSESRSEIRDTSASAQVNLFEQFTNVLQAVATEKPLLLVIDDAQWADVASINLMFHLGRRLEGSRILLLVTYRPEDVALGRNGHRHPLEPVTNEFERIYGNIQVDLDRAMSRRFVEAYLDIQANQLGSIFRTALYGQTQGHPLFTVELVREMRQRGDIVRDEQGRWVEGAELNWQTLPARVEAVIKERLGRLEPGLREMLTIASVEGETFTAQVVARVQSVPERQILRHLSQELAGRHHLVREQGEDPSGSRILSGYRFTHALFQQYLYNGLGSGERRLLHAEIAQALEELYQDRLEAVTVHLARHYAEAGQDEKAVDYLRQAGDRARGLYAHQEATNYYRQALIFQKKKGDYAGAARMLMQLGLTYHQAFDFKQARQAYDEGFTLWQQVKRFEVDSPLPPAPHALRLAWGEPVTLEPTMCADNCSEGIICNLFSGLLEQRPEMEITPDVAQSWEVRSGGREYLFQLRDDVRWSDGVPVTARDFEYAWKRILDPKTGSLNARLLYDIKGAKAFHHGAEANPDRVGVYALDEVTLIVELEEPTGYFPNLLTSAATYPLPRHVVDGHGERWTDVEHIVTNGPFMLESWQQRQRLVLTRNAGYHGRFSGNVERVELDLFSDLSALARYQRDELDLFHNLWNLPVTEWQPILYRHAGEHVSLPELATHYLRFDTARAPFDDARIRRAFILAADQETLADVVLQGFVFPATGGFIPAGIPGHSAGIGLPYNPEQARHLLAEAGFPAGQGFPVVQALAPQGREPWCEYLQRQWQENLGVQTTWEILTWAMFIDRLNSMPPPLVINGWVADYPDPDNFLRVGLPSEEIGWRNETYIRLVEQARRVADQAERMRLYGQADRILVQDAALMPLIYRRFQMLIKPWVKKYPTSANRNSFWKDVFIEPH
jgi:ABC-type oligopeptide transport system substrate-binding subunit